MGQPVPFRTGSLPGDREYMTLLIRVNLYTFSTGSLPGEREYKTWVHLSLFRVPLTWVNLFNSRTGSLPGDREYLALLMGQPVYLWHRVPSR